MNHPRRNRRQQVATEAETPGATPAAASSASSPSLVGIGLGVAGVLVTVLGLWLVSRGDITAAPLLLVLAYLVLFPLALTR